MHVFLIAALTQDGFIAKSTHDPAIWSSKADKQFFRERTTKAGVIVMGQTTFNTIGHPLSDRLNIVYTRNPKLLQSTPLTNPWFTNLKPHDLVTQLEAKGYTELAICGGASIYTLFMQSGLINTLYLTEETNINFGQGIPLFSQDIPLPLPTKTTPLSDTTILKEYNL